MSRKDYNRIAEAFKVQRHRATVRMEGAPVSLAATLSHEIRAIDNLAMRLASTLQEDNPRFDRERFLDACGLPSLQSTRIRARETSPARLLATA